ncbi:IS4 family transposase [Amycolatopsis eburnea]|uniref:IS4 family transposase n=1 Tax=Amycolatopsis eburnea TaxID=2267691 RepID=UPI001CDBCC13|nr:IS4 family transposase [Amycolatopsis eburnea]
MRVAAGVFAPGHLGELTQIVPFEMVDAVLAESTPAAPRRVRLLPARVAMYFLLAMGLFPELGYRGVWSKLTAGLDGLKLVTPSTSALRQARRRVGVPPLTALFELLAGPLAWPRTPGVCWRGLRLVAIDGTGIAIPDSGTNQTWTDKPRTAAHPDTGYPLLRLVTLVECGTRALIAAVFGSPADGELVYASKLLPRLRPGTVLLADRNFDAATFITTAAGTGADLLIRLKANRRPPRTGRHTDGSITSIIGGVEVRIIEARITVTTADGSRRSEHYRLVTTLLDPQRYPATELIELYHQRWDIETAYLALKHTLTRGRVLRSRNPAGVEQELWALLVTYQILRIAMTDATGSRPGLDPDRAGFSIALHAARDQIITARSVIAGTRIDLVGTIGRQVLAGLHPTRRARICPRTVKRPLSKYAYKKPRQPRSCLTAAIDVTVTNAATSPLTRTTPP